MRCGAPAPSSGRALGRRAAPSRAGTDPVEVKSDSLDLLRDDGDTLTVVVAAPQRKGDDDLDPEALVDSVRLSG